MFLMMNTGCMPFRYPPILFLFYEVKSSRTGASFSQFENRPGHAQITEVLSEIIFLEFMKYNHTSIAIFFLSFL